MKKICFLLTILCMTIFSFAQTKGGLPWSVAKNTFNNVSTVFIESPDFVALQAQALEDEIMGVAKPYMVAERMLVDFTSQNSGSWIYTEDGAIWRMSLTVPGSKALALYFENFQLPIGTSMYFYSPDASQIYGAFTTANSNDIGTFTHPEIAGDQIVVELNVKSGVNLESIDFKINAVASYYRGVTHSQSYDLDILSPFVHNNIEKERPTDVGDASLCHVNANCPEADNYLMAKKSTLRIVAVTQQGIGYCSGSLINNTGNSKTNCKPYFLTASHCEGSNSKDDATFAQWSFDYNFEYEGCDAGPRVRFSRTVGAKLKSRSNNPSIPNSKALVADVMLLELSTVPPDTAEAYLVGWNRDPFIHNNDDLDYYIGFHHPAGDLKKLAVADFVDFYGTFNQNSISATHWGTTAKVGGSEGGSSGSGLFDKNGLLVGVLSGGPAGTGSCAPLGISKLYSKLSYAWDNDFDQTLSPGAQSRLRDWLDPVNSGVMSYVSTEADCQSLSFIDLDTDNPFSSAFLLYPNPSSDGKVNVKANFDEYVYQLKIDVYDILGRKILAHDKVLTSNTVTFQLDLQGFSSGAYMVKISNVQNQDTYSSTIYIK